MVTYGVPEHTVLGRKDKQDFSATVRNVTMRTGLKWKRAL